MSLAVRLKNAREKAGYSQKDVAEKLNISRQSVSKWENGWTSPDIDNLILLSKLYGVTTDSLLKDSSENTNHNFDSRLHTTEKNYGFHEEFMLMLATIISCMIPGIGLIITLSIMIYCKAKRKQLTNIHKMVMIMCLIINLINTWSWLNTVFFHLGKATIEKVALMNYIGNTLKSVPDITDLIPVLSEYAFS